MILVTGATGTVGRLVTGLLRDGGFPVRAMSRPGSGRPLPSGVAVVRADLDDPVSLRAAVAGVRSVFLLTAPPVPTPAHDLALLAAARAEGVTTVVKLSAIGTGERFGGATVGGGGIRRARTPSGAVAWHGRCCGRPVSPATACTGRLPCGPGFRCPIRPVTAGRG